MNKAKVEKNINNLKKIREIIEISKFDTLQKLQHATKISDTYLEMALSAKELIDFARENYRVKEKKVKVKATGVLWVYVTPEAEMMSISNRKFEQIIKKTFNKEQDSIIVLGDKAMEFAKRESLKVEFEAKTSYNYESAVSIAIWSSIARGSVAKVNFVINSPKLENEPITIFPMAELNLPKKKLDLKVDKTYKFYPSMSRSLQALTRIYIFRITFAFIKESQFFYLKEKLIRHEGSIKSVDAKIEEKSRDMKKLNRKNETEELILVSQIAKRGVKDE